MLQEPIDNDMMYLNQKNFQAYVFLSKYKEMFYTILHYHAFLLSPSVFYDYF